MLKALTNARIFTADQWLENQALVFDTGRIQALLPNEDLPRDIQQQDLSGQYLVPGLIDTQVNGGGGVLFNDAPTLNGLRTLTAAHRRFGTTGLLPTLISDDRAVMARALQAVDDALAQGLPGLLGIHLEGPFLNPKRKGVHDEHKFQILDEAGFELLISLKKGRTLVTLAPECTRPEMIQRLVQSGVIVAAGHTAATYEQTREALTAGLNSFTHLFNAMTPLTGRQPGVVGAALEDPNSWCGLIVDGHHVHPASLKVAIAAKPRGKMLLVTDAMPSVGAKNKSFWLKGEHIQARDGRCATADGTLAGSDLDMLSAVRNSVELLNLPLAEALRMASLYPAQMLGLDTELGRLEPGYRANMIALNPELELTHSWIEGRTD
mgnify:CR=1 FL=1